MKRRHRTRASNERGQNAVEFALICGVFFLLVSGLMDVGRAVWYFGTLQDAVRQGTRFAVVHGSASGSPVGPGATGAVVAVVDRYGKPALDASRMTVTASYLDSGNAPGNRIEVRASYPFDPLMGFGFGPFTLTASSTRQIIH